MMLSFFNPWILLSILIAICSAFGAGYYRGERMESIHQMDEIQHLNAEARQRERALTSAVNITSTQLVKANNDAKLQTQKLHSALDSGSFKLRIPIKTTICPIRTTADSFPSAGDSDQATAELDRETAKNLVAITDDGDKAIRQLNACIDAYNNIYNTLNQKK